MISQRLESQPDGMKENKNTSIHLHWWKVWRQFSLQKQGLLTSPACAMVRSSSWRSRSWPVIPGVAVIGERFSFDRKNRFPFPPAPPNAARYSWPCSVMSSMVLPCSLTTVPNGTFTDLKKQTHTHTHKTSQDRLSKVRPDSWSKWVPFMMKCRDSHECRLGCHSDHNSSCCLPIPHPPPCKVELLVLMIWQSGQLKADKKGIRIKAWRNSFLLKNLLSIWSWLWFLSIHTHRPLH